MTSLVPCHQLLAYTMNCYKHCLIPSCPGMVVIKNITIQHIFAHLGYSLSFLQTCYKSIYQKLEQNLYAILAYGLISIQNLNITQMELIKYIYNLILSVLTLWIRYVFHHYSKQIIKQKIIFFNQIKAFQFIFVVFIY